MKIEFDRNQVLKVLQRVTTVAEKKTTMPILGNVLLSASGGQLTVSATDLEIGVQSSDQVKIIAEGKICTPAQNFLEIIKELPEKTVRLQKDENNWIVISSGKAQFKIAGVAAEEFPQMASPNDFKFQKLRAATILSAVEKTSFAMSTDEMRYNLNGVFVESKKGKDAAGFRMVATDGHRLSMFTQPLYEDETLALPKGVIFPRKGVTELKRLLSEAADTLIEVAVTENSAAFRIDGTMLYMRLVVGEFPDYTAVIPKANKKKLVVNREIFSNSLRRVSLLSEGKSKCVRFDVKGNGVHLAANSPELGEAKEDIPGEFDGGELNIGFNAKYVLEAMAAAKGDKVLFELDHEQSPGIIKTPDDATYLGVVMPMRI